MGPVSKAEADPAPDVPVTVVHADACHFCEDALDALRDLTEEYPLWVTAVPADSPEGQRLLAEHRVGMFPLVLVDGRYFSQGRLPRRKLRMLLEERAAAVGVV